MTADRQVLSEDESPLADAGYARAIISILVIRLGGQVKITQEDFDSIAHHFLVVNGEEDCLTLTHQKRIQNG